MTININGGNVLGVCSETGWVYGAGIGRGGSATTETTITITGNNAVVAAQGATAFLGTAATATPKEGTDYQIVCDDKHGNTLTSQPDSLNLLNLGAAYAMIYFLPSSIDITIGSTGWATAYYGHYNLVVPEGVTANTYYVEQDALIASMTYEAGDIIPAGTAVVLRGAEGTYKFAVTKKTGTKPAKSMLYGYDEAASTAVDGMTDGYNFYRLTLESKTSNKAGFFFYYKGGRPFKSTAHKAFLAVPKEQISSAMAWIFETIGSTGWATTYYSEYNLEVPEGVKARTYYVESGAIKVDHVYAAGDVIPAGTAVVLCDSIFKGCDYSFCVTSEKGEAATKSMLYGFDEASQTVAPDGTTDGYVFYKFSLDNSGEHPGFYWDQENGKPFVIGGHKAYLCVDTENAKNSDQLLMGNVVGIESVNADAEEDNRLFDLSGRQRGTDTHSLPSGVYIRGGKKIVVK